MTCQHNLRFFVLWNAWNVPWNAAAKISVLRSKVVERSAGAFCGGHAGVSKRGQNRAWWSRFLLFLVRSALPARQCGLASAVAALLRCEFKCAQRGHSSTPSGAAGLAPVLRHAAV